MHRTLLPLMVFALLLGTALRAEEDASEFVTNDEQGVLRVYPGGRAFAELSPGQQADVIRRLRAGLQNEERKEGDFYGSAGLAVESLININTEETLGYAVAQMRAKGPGSLMAFAILRTQGDERVLPLLIDEIYNGSDEPADPTIPGYPSIRKIFAGIAGRIIQRSQVLPPATREYGNRLGSVAEFMAWWEHNKAAILAKDYAKATWLPPAVGGETPLATPNAPTNPASVTPTPLPPASPDSASPLKWLALASATLAAFALGWRLWRRR
jgi:hypothetical protein